MLINFPIYQFNNKLAKQILICTLVTLSMVNVFAQKQSFDVVNYEAPKGWDKSETPNGVQLSTKDDGKGNYAAVVIVKSITTTGSAQDNFNDSWEKLVKGTVKVAEASHLSDMNVEKGWHVLSGQANYNDGTNKGIVTLITATGNGKMANVVIMTNTSKYQEEILAFVNSLELNETASAQKNTGTSATTNNNVNNPAVTGLWTNYILENNGYSNGLPMVTGGYARSEYLLKADGSYIYRVKNWMVYGAKYILFVYETGSYSINGNQITFTPKTGKGGWWGKTKSTKEWGPFVKGSDYKPERKTYTFEIKNSSVTNDITLILKTGAQEYSYTQKPVNESMIDNPPGFKN